MTTEGMGHYPRPRQKDDLVVRELPTHVKGLENPNEPVHNVIRWMVKNGYSDEEVSKVAGKNALKLLEQVW
jgi:microsomal dipeptidase-like Zn-dependent dipeptidase